MRYQDRGVIAGCIPADQCRQVGVHELGMRESSPGRELSYLERHHVMSQCHLPNELVRKESAGRGKYRHRNYLHQEGIHEYDEGNRQTVHLELLDGHKCWSVLKLC